MITSLENFCPTKLKVPCWKHLVVLLKEADSFQSCGHGYVKSLFKGAVAASTSYFQKLCTDCVLPSEKVSTLWRAFEALGRVAGSSDQVGALFD